MLNQETVGIEVQVDMPFKLAADMVGGGIWEFGNDMDRKGADGIGCGWVPAGQSSRPCKWTGAHLHVLRASDPFLQCKMHYI